MMVIGYCRQCGGARSFGSFEFVFPCLFCDFTVTSTFNFLYFCELLFFFSRNVLSYNRRQSSIFTNNAHVALKKHIYTPSVDNGWSFLMMKIGNEIQSESDVHKFLWSM